MLVLIQQRIWIIYEVNPSLSEYTYLDYAGTDCVCVCVCVCLSMGTYIYIYIYIYATAQV